MIPAKPFYLIRHGESTANASGITAGGGTDSTLTTLGREQAQQVARVIDTLEIKPKKVIHSPMVRARDTALTINEALDLLTHEVDELREHMVGEWEGRPWEETMPLIKAGHKPKDGESRDEFAARVRRVFNEVLADHEDPVMIVAHGGIFHALTLIYDHQAEFSVKNCHLHYFEPFPDHEPFPWRVWAFDVEENMFLKQPAPFCATYFMDEIAS